VPVLLKSGILSPLEPPGLVLACTGIALAFIPCLQTRFRNVENKVLWAALLGSTIQIDRTFVISSLFDFGERRIAVSKSFIAASIGSFYGQ
jgi:hypothetical protein